MADTTTPTLNLTKPDFNGAADIRVFSTNMDLIDAAAAATNDALDAATPMTTPGDLIVGGSSGVPGRLGVGTNGHVLTALSGAPAWAPATPLTTPGDLLVGGAAGALGRLGIGAETQALTVVGGTPAWTPPTYGGMTNPMTAPGDVIVGSTGGGPVRVGKGAEGQVLTVAASPTGLAWAAPTTVQSLLTNGSCDVWQRGNGPFSTDGAYTADRWFIASGGSTVTVDRESSTVDTGSLYAMRVVLGAGAGGAVVQAIEDYAQLRGRTITFAARVRAATAPLVRAGIWDGTTWTDGNYNAIPAGYDTVTVTVTLPAGATALRVRVSAGTATTFYVDNAVLVVGATAPAFAPRHAADELARCRRYYEVLGSGVFEEPFALGQVRSIAEVRFPLFYAEKAVVPTVTFSAQNHFGCWISDFSSEVAFTSLTAGRIGLTSCLCTGLANLTGSTAGMASLVNAVNLSARIRIEANPP